MHHAHLTEAIHGGNLAAAQTLDNLQVSGRSVAQALASVDRMINAQADVLSANDVFYASAILLPLIWLTRRTRSAAADAGGAH